MSFGEIGGVVTRQQKYSFLQNCACQKVIADGVFVVFSQRIRATVNTQEQKRLLMDLDISMRTVDCFYTVTFYGALFREVTAICRFLFWPQLFFTECLKFFLFSPRLLPYVLPGRCMDLHGADGHVPGQVLQEGDREGPDHPRGHPGEDRRLCECRNI